MNVFCSCFPGPLLRLRQAIPGLGSEEAQARLCLAIHAGEVSIEVQERIHSCCFC